MPFERFLVENPQRTLHFIAANGFPPASYQPLFSCLKKTEIVSPLLRPLWRPRVPAKLRSWMDFADDIHDYVQAFKPKYVMGHSIGAVIWVLYAYKYNYEFDCIVMIDPALFSWHLPWIYRVIKAFHLQRRLHPMIPKTLKRQVVFESKDIIKENYASKSVFSKFSSESLDAYINAAFCKTDQGYELLFSPEWEALIYEYGMLDDAKIWKGLSQLQAEVVLIRGEHSDVCTPGIEKRMRRVCSRFESHCVPGATHLLPFEFPEEVALAC